MESWNGRLEGAIRAQELDPEFLAHWWTGFEDPVLDSLIERAAVANLDIRAAQSQLRAARAQRVIAGTYSDPTVDARGGATLSGTQESSQELYSVGLDASWELDVFGGIERGVEAAEADFEAAEEARRDVLVTVLAEVALNYADLRTLQRRELLTQDNLKAQEEHLAIIRAQTEAGVATQLDLDRSIANVESTRSTLPALAQQVSQIKNRIAVLCGENPGALDGELDTWRELQVPSMEIAVGVPAEVLRRRPDVRRSERILAAETARVGVAVADLYPRFSLNGSIGLESDATSSLFDLANGLFSLGPRVQWNLFDGGRIRQQIEIQSALQEQAMIAYEGAILGSLEEVQNAITGFGQERLRLHSLQLAKDSAARAALLAQERFDAGVTNFLDVLDAQRSRLAAEDELAQSQGAIVNNLIRLYKALGGGWESVDAKGASASE